MQNIQKLFLIIVLPFFIGGCNSNTTLPDFTGKSGEILLVKGADINNKTVFAVKQILETEIDYLPQAEKSFTVFTIPESKLNGIYKKHRNIFYLKSGTKNQLSLNRDLWATNQLVYTYIVNKNETTLKLLKQQLQLITNTYNSKEIERLQNSYTNPINTQITEIHFITLKIPPFYYVAKNTPNFFWLRKETKETSFGVIGYYGNPTPFLRDSVLKNTLLGPTKGSYMVAKPFTHYTYKTDNSSYEKGIWEMENDVMGGVFVAKTITNKSKNNLNLYAYLYAPGKKKRELIRELEAIIESVKLNE